MAFPSSNTDLGVDWRWDSETISKANGFLNQIQSSSFLVAFYILLQILQVLKELTLKLQSLAMDVVHAYKSVSSVICTLKFIRANNVTEFQKLFTSVRELGKELYGDEFDIVKPRLVGRMVHRGNPTHCTTEEYYRVTMYNEFISHVISELEDRFSNNPAHTTTMGLLFLLPSECIKLADGFTLPNELADCIRV